MKAWQVPSLKADFHLDYRLGSEYGFDNVILPKMLRSQTVIVSKFFQGFFRGFFRGSFTRSINSSV